MHDLKSRYGTWCLVAGAAEGLGAAFSRALAMEGMNLILVDRQKELLDTLAGQLESSFGVAVKKIHLDLSSAGSVPVMIEVIAGTSCRLFIYNAAFSRVRKFVKNGPEDLERYLQVNMQTPIRLILAFCNLHAGTPDRKKGMILISSLAGSWGTQLLAPYGASKAFNHILAESLYYELKGEGFDVLASITGATSTPGYLSSLPEERRNHISVMTPDTVVEACFRALGRSPYVIPGFRNRLIYFFLTRIVPRKASIRIMNRAVGKLYADRR